VITIDDVRRPEPRAGQLLVRLKAGVGNWDALIREGKVKLEPLPRILGSELSGVIEALGAGVTGFRLGDEVYGATNEQFSGAYAEYAVPLAGMMAQKPQALTFTEAASAPIVAVTAWEMLFEYAQVTAGQTVLIHAAAGNVGAYAVQLARQAGLHVVATVASSRIDYVRRLGADRIIDYQTARFEESLSGVDVVLDSVGGDTQLRSLRVLKPGGKRTSALCCRLRTLASPMRCLRIAGIAAERSCSVPIPLRARAVIRDSTGERPSGIGTEPNRCKTTNSSAAPFYGLVHTLTLTRRFI
jgi:NADPH:quinone reductase-like Zn-dependent oxidoreductase